MKKQIQKDSNIRKLFNKQELTSNILKNIIKYESFSLILKWNAVLKLFDLSIKFNKTRFVNRCILTGRKAKFSIIFKKFSRLSFLRLARAGSIVGFWAMIDFMFELGIGYIYIYCVGVLSIN